MKPTAAMEDYLEAIIVLQGKKEEVRIKKLAEHLGIKPPSVIEMMKNLKNNGYVLQKSRGDITLTEKGILVAKQVKKRHDILKKFFHKILELDEDIAEKDACKIEHHLSPETYNKLANYVDFILKDK